MIEPANFLALPGRWTNLAHVVDAFYADDGSGDLVLVTTAVELVDVGQGRHGTDAHHVRIPAAEAPAVAAELGRRSARPPAPAG